MMRTLLASEVAVKRLVITGVSGLALLVAAGCSSSKPQDAGLMGPRQVVPPPYKDPASVAASTAAATEPVVVAEEPADVKGKGKDEGPKAFSLPPKVESKIDTYTVKSGDSFSKIGAKYGVSAAELAAFNKLSEKKAIKVGQSLRIPPGGTVSHKATGKSKHVASATHKKGEGKHHAKRAGAGVKKGEGKAGGTASAAPAGEGKYSVKKGDSIDSIAKKHHVKIADLRAANDLKSDKLQIGQTLVIPGKKGETAVAATDAAVATPVAGAAAEETAAVAPAATVAPTGTDAAAVAPVATGTDAAPAPAPAPAANTLDHTVLTGETLESIAEMYSTTAEAIIKLNPAIKGNADLKPNMTIQIPLSK
jgi:LysM repeat protein